LYNFNSVLFLQCGHHLPLVILLICELKECPQFLSSHLNQHFFALDLNISLGVKLLFFILSQQSIFKFPLFVFSLKLANDFLKQLIHSFLSHNILEAQYGHQLFAFVIFLILVIKECPQFLSSSHLKQYFLSVPLNIYISWC